MSLTYVHSIVESRIAGRVELDIHFSNLLFHGLTINQECCESQMLNRLAVVFTDAGIECISVPSCLLRETDRGQ